MLHGLQIHCATLQAHVTHPELKATFQLPIIGVKKNPSSPLYTQLGVLTKGTIIEVNVSELGLVTTTGVLAFEDWVIIHAAFLVYGRVTCVRTAALTSNVIVCLRAPRQLFALCCVS
jgi:ribosomal protein S8E